MSEMHGEGDPMPVPEVPGTGNAANAITESAHASRCKAGIR
jgi:hypothetical protein